MHDGKAIMGELCMHLFWANARLTRAQPSSEYRSIALS